MINTELQSELASWTSRVVGAHAIGPRVPAAPGAGAPAGEFVTVSMFTVLQRAIRHINQRHPLCTLPRPVILCLCSYLDMLDILMLSHTSHGVRAALLGVPEVWSSVPFRPAEIWLLDNAMAGDILSSYLGRSNPFPFDASLVLAGDMISEQLPLLAHNMHRMATLRLLCADSDFGYPGHSWSSFLRCILSEPAPQLTTLHIFYSPIFPGGTPMVYEPLVLWDVFRGAAPALRRVKLSLVRLPANLDCPAFRDITIFVYDLYGTTTAADLHVLSQMPRLEVFHWGGYWAPSPGDAETEGAVANSCSRSLRTVLLSFRNDFDAVDLRGFLPVDQLRELWITTPGHDTARSIPDLYVRSRVHGVSLSCSSSGLAVLLHVVHPGGGEVTSVVLNTRHIRTQIDSLLTPFVNITWLTIYDYLWDNEVSGTPPVLPAVAMLTVNLASFDDYVREWHGRWFFSPWSAGVFTADPACRWSLPALREVRITSPPEAKRDPEVQECILSVSLEDIARWIRDSIAIEPPGRKLDAVVLSGLRIIDRDFCAAWDAIMRHSHSLDLVEKPDTLHHTAVADMDFNLRSSQFVGEREPGW